jgi:ADP-ribose pyrophosphatase YjhB (NUDIX family)
VKVSARRLFGLRHKAKQAYDPDARDFYKLFFLCERQDGTPPRPGAETSEAGFFRLDHLPALSRGRVIESDIRAAFSSASDNQRPVFFD